jgi:hypothetical protein
LVGGLALEVSTILKLDFTDTFPLSNLFTAVLAFVGVFGAGWVGDGCPVVVPDVE